MFRFSDDGSDSFGGVGEDRVGINTGEVNIRRDVKARHLNYRLDPVSFLLLLAAAFAV